MTRGPRSELSLLLDHDKDGRCDEVRCISNGWGLSGNYHEFAFGLPIDRAHDAFVALNVGFWEPKWWHGKSKAPWRGWIAFMAPLWAYQLCLNLVLQFDMALLTRTTTLLAREAGRVRLVVPLRGEVLLVDDIVTTGATARESVRALGAAGARVTAVLTLAHA